MNKLYIASTLAGAVGLALALHGAPVRADEAMDNMMKMLKEEVTAGKVEKCFGVALKGKNDCASATVSCAGHSTTDGDKAAFVAVPTGLCEKLVHGSTTSM